jgi:hypothetical protein
MIQVSASFSQKDTLLPSIFCNAVIKSMRGAEDMKRIDQLTAQEFNALVDSELIRHWSDLSYRSEYCPIQRACVVNQFERSVLEFLEQHFDEWVPLDELRVAAVSQRSLRVGMDKLISHGLITFWGGRKWDDDHERERMTAPKGWVLNDCAVKITEDGFWFLQPEPDDTDE